MGLLGLKVTVYSQKNHYSSYRGNVGHVAPNLLKQKFNEHRFYRVMHTDITQLKLTNHQFGYSSVVIDETSNEVLATQISSGPNQALIKKTLHGWHYQLPYYRNELAKAHCTLSMSRKGNLFR